MGRQGDHVGIFSRAHRVHISGNKGHLQAVGGSLVETLKEMPVSVKRRLWYNLFKGLGEGMLLERWISGLLVSAGHALDPEDLAVAATLSSLDMLRSGTTPRGHQ